MNDDFSGGCKTIQIVTVLRVGSFEELQCWSTLSGGCKVANFQGYHDYNVVSFKTTAGLRRGGRNRLG